eukprot:COSAG02_NODE_471_length_21662_cov_70.510040_20_plen_94_part_00
MHSIRRLISLCLEVMTFYISLSRQIDDLGAGEGPGVLSPNEMSPGGSVLPHAAAPEARKEVEAYSPIMVLLLRNLHMLSPPSQFAKHLPTFYL